MTVSEHFIYPSQQVPTHHLYHSQTQIISHVQKHSGYRLVTFHLHSNNHPCDSSISERDSVLLSGWGETERVIQTIPVAIGKVKYKGIKLFMCMS